MTDLFKEEKEASAIRLREIRLNMGVSQEKFAEYLDISLSAYKKIESAENGISVRILRTLKQQFNISSDYLLYGDYKNFDSAMELIENCTEEDKMKLYLRLTQYFVNDKKKIFVEKKKDLEYPAKCLKNILDME